MMLKEKVFLTATDTTIGFVSQNARRLTEIKARPPHKHYIKAVNSLLTLKHFTRIPAAHRKTVRRARNTTFVTPDGRSYRVIRDPHHLQLLDRLTWAYTTSANRSGESYNEAFAIASADVVVAPLIERNHPSKIIKLGKFKCKRIR